MGTEPNDDELPIDLGDFPIYFQYIFSIYNMLPDKWEGMSGTYMGKDYGILPFIFDMEDITDRKQKRDIFQLITLIDLSARKFYNDKQAQERKAKEASRHKGRSIKG